MPINIKSDERKKLLGNISLSNKKPKMVDQSGTL